MTDYLTELDILLWVCSAGFWLLARKFDQDGIIAKSLYASSAMVAIVGIIVLVIDIKIHW